MKKRVSNMKWLRFAGLAIFYCLFSGLANQHVGHAYEDTECFKCHTSAKKLIELTREIGKTRPALKSAETEGEG